MSEKKSEEPKTASAGHTLVTLCKRGCGEIKRRRHRSDAQQWMRSHLKEHPKHEVEIVERKIEAVKPKEKAAKPAAKKRRAAKTAKAKKALKGEAQKAAAA
jgi:hypothetical protein